MSGRVPGSKKCPKCSWIHLLEQPCTKMAKLSKALHTDGVVPLEVTYAEALNLNVGSPMYVPPTRAAQDVRSIEQRMNYLEARMALIEARQNSK